MSHNGSLSVNSVRQAWVTATSTKEALSRRSGPDTARSDPITTQLDLVRGSDAQQLLSQVYGKQNKSRSAWERLQQVLV